MNLKFYACSVMLLLTLASCKKENPAPGGITTKEDSVKTLVVDSVKISDSVRLSPKLSLGYENTMLVFPSLKSKSVLDSIYFQYPELTDFSKTGVEKFLQNEKKIFFNNTQKDNEEWMAEDGSSVDGKWYENASMKVVSNKNGFLHIRYSGASYMGGAHGNYYFSERVFDLQNNRRLLLSDITTMPAEELSVLLRKNIDKNPGNASDDKGRIASSDMLLVDKIPATGNFYFDGQNLYFHYSPYEITAFAAGDIIIPVSWETLKSTLKPEFRKRMHLQ